MIIYISLPRKYDKTEVIFRRVHCKKRQKAIKVSKIKTEPFEMQEK